MSVLKETPPLTTSRTFVLGQRIRYDYSAPVTELRQQLKTIPPATYGFQRRQRWHLRVNGVHKPSTQVSLDPFFNVMIETQVPRVDDSVEFEVEIEVEIHLKEAGLVHTTRADRRYLFPTPLTAPDGAIKEIAAQAKPGDAASLCERVHKSLQYEWGVTGVHTTASEAIAGGRGVCQDYAHIMLAACRQVGLPARYVSGHLPGEGGSHAWIEVLRPAGRDSSGAWTTEGWDPTHNRQVNSDYMVIAVGRDYADTAPLSGTYNGDGVTSTLSVDKQLHVC